MTALARATAYHHTPLQQDIPPLGSPRPGTITRLYSEGCTTPPSECGTARYIQTKKQHYFSKASISSAFSSRHLR